MEFSPQALQTLAVISACLAALIWTRLAADVILFGGLVVLLFFGVLEPTEALHGFANEGMATVAVLFVVARALSETGVVSWLSQNLLGRPNGNSTAQLRLMAPVAVLSSVLNNTPVVAMLVPAVRDWAKRNNLSVQQLMIPLSYAAIIGGTCTLVGTSTNLVINGMLQEQLPEKALGLFDLAWVGVPAVVLVILFTVAFGRWLLPCKAGEQERFEDARQYVVEMLVEPGSVLAGRSVEEAGLRQLPGMYLIEVQRNGQLISPVSPRQTLVANDRLVFAGDVRAVADLKNIHGLKLAEDQAFKLGVSQSSRCLVEVVLSSNFRFLGRTVKEMDFRRQYNSAIIAVSRDGEHIKSRIGDISLQAGDTLLLETHDGFARAQRYSRDFLLVSEIENSRPVRHQLRGVAAGIMVLMVLLAATGVLSMFKAALLAAGLMILTRCIRVQDARNSVDWQVLIVIAASIGLGVAMDKTGAAASIAHLMVLAAGTPILALAALFFLTSLFSAVVSNLAAAVLMFPVALAASTELGVDVTPFAVTLMVAASTCFATPIGYQTNLMVYGPGEYRFSDFMRIGIPLTVLVGVLTVGLVPVFWPL